MDWFEPLGQGWKQVVELVMALLLCSAIGLEREFRRKSAGMRTHAIVGVGAALFMLISKYGFTDVLYLNHVSLDPSRVAAQIVSGIGFIGAGIIFVRRDAVRGLTTAAAIWISCAVGTACGAGLPLLALVATACYFTVVHAFPPLITRLPATRLAYEPVTINYTDGQGHLRSILAAVTELGYAVVRIDTHRRPQPDLVSLTLELRGRGDLGQLGSRLTDLDGVQQVSVGASEADTE